MAKKFAQKFYHSKEWKQCRAAYITKVAGLCERCKQNGIIRSGIELHHKIEITPENINNPDITLNHDNLIFLCHDCHMILHGEKNIRRYIIDNDGCVSGVDIPPIF